jgi:hypothetical protein
MKSESFRDYELDYESCAREIVERSKGAYDQVLRTKTFYRLFVGLVFAGLLYSLISYPILTVLFFFFCYVGHHICFMSYHSSLHAQFIELDHRKLLTGPFIAFVHHYVHPRLLCCWEHRASYQSSVVLLSFFPIFFLCFYWGGLAMLPFVCTFLLWHLTSSPIHEWYHMPAKNRREYFNRFEYFVYSFLERHGLISTREHVTHHRHQINNKKDVVEFDDVNVGKGLSRFFDALWTLSLRVLYRQDKKYLTVFYSLFYMFSLALVSGVALLVTRLLQTI